MCKHWQNIRSYHKELYVCFPLFRRLVYLQGNDFSLKMEIDDIFGWQNLSAVTRKTVGNEKLEKRIVNMIQLVRDANFNSQNKILNMVIYKHHNQLRKQKSLQYAKKIANLTSKLETVKVVALLRCIKDQLQNKHCFYQSEGRSPISADTGNAARQLICIANLIREILKRCEVGLSVTNTDLGSATFVTFYTFLFAHLSRLGITMACIHEEFIDLFKILLEINPNDCILKEDLKASIDEQFDSIFLRKLSQNLENKPKNNDIPGELEEELLKGQFSEETMDSFDVGEIVQRKAVDRENQINTTKATTAYVKQKFIAAKPYKIKKMSKVTRHYCICWKCSQNRKFFRRARQPFLRYGTSL